MINEFILLHFNDDSLSVSRRSYEQILIQNKENLDNTDNRSQYPTYFCLRFRTYFIFYLF